MERLPHALVRALAERALGTAVTGVAADTLGGSNAVFFLDLRGGDRCVLRVSPPGQADLVAQEAWALGAAGCVGVPTPAVLVADTSLCHLDRPYLLLRWLPGVPAFRAPLAPGGRADVLAQLGQHLARLHGLALDGFGPLRGGAGANAGAASSWWGYIRAEGIRRLARLPGTALPLPLARRIARHFDAAAAWRAPGRAVLVHGDFQLKNVLVRGAHVTGILDFENLLAGDPLLDFAPLRYWSRDPARTMAALQRGYGRSPLADPDAGRRLALYELLLALEIRWWEDHLGLPATRHGALARLARALRTLEAPASGRATPVGAPIRRPPTAGYGPDRAGDGRGDPGADHPGRDVGKSGGAWAWRDRATRSLSPRASTTGRSISSGGRACSSPPTTSS